jgi:hypothetical protein
MHTGFQWVNLKKRDNLQDPGVDGRTILNLVINVMDVTWILLAEGRGKWWTLLNMVMNLNVP